MRRSVGAAVLVAAVLTAACAGATPAPPVATGDPGLPVPADAFTATVDRAVDGDTLVARVRGQRVRVRLVGIDTPESVKPDTPVACFGHEASALTSRLTAGRTVRASFQVEHTDAYDRQLWDVWLPDGRWLQGVLVASGVARPYPFKPNTAHAPQLQDLARTAHDARRGLWGSCSLAAAFPQLAGRS